VDEPVAFSLTREQTGERSFEELFAEEYPRLTRALFLLCGDTAQAEDLAQEAMARVYERWERVRTMESPTGYAYTVALNLHRRSFRRANLFQRKAWPAREEADHVAQAETRSDVRRALSSMPLELRTTLVLSEWLGMTSPELGQAMGIRPGSARARLHRARAVFRDLLGDDYG
jgi:RNA polymerase sigma factor (sigma-70 family)